MKLNKTHANWGVAAATLTMAGALVSPQVLSASKAEHALQATDSKVEALESQVNQMSQMLQSMQDELTRVRTAASRNASESSAKVQELDQWMASVKSTPVAERTKDNMAFFRGGHGNDSRGTFGAVPGGGTLVGGIGASGDPLVGAQKADKDAFYFGAAMDFSLNDDLFGLMDNTQFLAELGVEYKEFADDTYSGVTGQNVTTNQLTISVSPKIKFLKGSDFRPWLIPAGFDVNIISPPSGAVTVLNAGLQAGIGADYKIWNNIYVGADARYHETFDTIDGVDTDGVTAGGYIGFGF